MNWLIPVTLLYLVADGMNGLKYKVDMQGTEPTKTCNKLQSKGVQSLEWQSLLAKKLNSAVLIWCIKTWEFVVVEFGNMIQQAVDA